MTLELNISTNSKCFDFGETSVDTSWVYAVLCDISSFCSFNGLPETSENILRTIDCLSLEENTALLPVRVSEKSRS